MGSGWNRLPCIIKVFIVGILVVESFSFHFQVLVPICVIFIKVGILRLWRFGNGCVAVWAVVLTVFSGRSVVGHQEKLLNVTLKDLFIQDPGPKHNDPIDVNDGEVAAVQRFGDPLLTI